MKPTLAQHDDFLANKPIAGITFGHGDYVNVIGGEFSGSSGSVQGVEDICDDAVYLVELESGQSIRVAASDLQPEGES
jgi:hypothetical protein